MFKHQDLQIFGLKLKKISIFFHGSEPQLQACKKIDKITQS